MTQLNAIKNQYIKKHNASIRSYSDMTLLQRKLANVLLYHAYNNLLKDHFHEITISEILSLLSIKTNDYQKLKQAIKKLMCTIIEWNVVQHGGGTSENNNKKGDEHWKACTLLSAVQIDGPIVRYEYSHTLRELFHTPSLYSKIRLTVQNRFKSVYSLALYENCMSYLNCGTTGWILFEAFRKLMGVSDSQYKAFRDFNRRVLKPAIIEVNVASNLVVNYEIKKRNRTVSHIKFFISNAKEQEFQTVHQEEGLIDELLKFGISEKLAASWLKQYEKDYILEKVALLSDSKTEIKNPAAFLKAAIMDDYKKNMPQKQILQQKTLTTYVEEKKIEKNKELLTKEYQEYLDFCYKNWLLTLACVDKNYFLDCVVAHFESLGFMFPFWKKAKQKLFTENWLEDSCVFQSIKIYLTAIKDDPPPGLNLPAVKTIEQYQVEQNVDEQLQCYTDGV